MRHMEVRTRMDVLIRLAGYSVYVIRVGVINFVNSEVQEIRAVIVFEFYG